MWFKLSLNKKSLFESMVEKHADEMTAFAFRLTGNYDTAEDLVQEAYAEAWKSINSLKDPNKSRSWLFRILRRRYADSFRKKNIEMITVEDHELNQVPSPLKSHADSIIEMDIITKAFSEVEEKFRLPFLMANLEGLTVAEIAKELQLPQGTVLSRIHRGRKALQTAMEKLSVDTIAEGGRYHVR